MSSPNAPSPIRRFYSPGRVLAAAVLLASFGWLAGWAQTGPDLEKLRARAEQSDSEAQNALGNAYNEGRAGLKQDYAEALKWYHRAAEKGFALAQYNLGLAYDLGHGVPVDERQALRYYLQAAEQGFGAAQFNVGNMYANGRGTGRDLFEANLWFKQAAEKGIVEAQFNLGLAYEAGRGVKKDEMQAARWYKQAADRDFPRAQHNLGLLFEDGRGVPKNDSTAAAYYRAAAEQGFGAAQTNYGIMLSTGRGGLTKDPVQAWVWLSLGVQNGSSPGFRDALTRNLDAEQLAAATRLFAERRTGIAQAATTPTPAPAVIAPEKPPVSAAVSADKPAPSVPPVRTPDLTAALNQATEANAQLADANQRLEVEKARLEQQLVQGNDSARLIEQMRAQNQRLAAQVQTLLAAKEASEREIVLLKTQVKDAQDDLTRVRGAPATTASVMDVSRYEKQLADITAELKQTTGSLSQLQTANQQLTESNARLQKEKENPAANSAKTDAPLPAGGDQSSTITNLQRDNARLNDEVKRSTRELLSLSSQLRSLRNQAVKPAAPDNAPAQQVAQLIAKAEQAAQDAARWQTESTRLAARVTELENLPKPVADNSVAGKLTDARQLIAQLQQQMAAVQGEKAELEKWSRSLEQTVNEKSALAEGAKSGGAELQQKLAQTLRQLEDAMAENRTLTTRVAQTEQALALRATSKPDTTELDGLRQQFAEVQQRLEKLDGEKQALSDRVAAEHRSYIQSQNRVNVLERDLREARKPAGNSPEVDGLRKQLADASQALEKSGATVAELTDTNDRLEKELASARQTSTETGELREELAKLKEEAVGLHLKSEQMGRDEEQTAAYIKSYRHDLTEAQARVAELEKQLADATTVRTRGGDGPPKLQADLVEANSTIEKLNATVAELTAANDRLEKDLENAKKSTEAALAAQAQAVTAARPDAYQMEISTLQSQVKDLESQIEEERNRSAKEVSTLAAQLTRTRETNKSLTEANRALLSAKLPETDAVDKAELAQLQAKVRELTAAGDVLRQQNEKLTDDSQSLLGELAGDKASLQKQLETAGLQLGKAQQDAEQVRAELAAVQSRAAEAEKATDSHSATVAELTQANAKLEQEREDMRRLVESYRADIARLTQNVRSAEQQRTAAERGAQQNIDAVTAQLAQLRRDLEGVRTAQARQAEASATQDRDRVGVINQLRTENGALAARLSQAQGTLDQIASAARLGTPAATIASGGLAPVRPVVTAPVSAPEIRFHTVTEGDSLSRISMRYYGTPNRWQEIYNANRDVLQGSSVLRVGMQLRIP